jgi:hypothetical protein
LRADGRPECISGHALWRHLKLGPLWEHEPTCVVCQLVAMTSQQVRWHDDEERGYAVDGESISAIDHRDLLETYQERRDHCNRWEFNIYGQRIRTEQ